MSRRLLTHALDADVFRARIKVGATMLAKLKARVPVRSKIKITNFRDISKPPSKWKTNDLYEH